MTDRTAKVVPIGALRQTAAASGTGEWRSADAQGETLGQAYLRRHAALRAFMLRRTGDPEVADELVQEVWLRIAADADVTGLGNPDSWLQKIAVNLTLNWLKSHRFRSRFTSAMLDDFDAADEAPDPERTALARQGVEYLKDVIEELPHRQRQAFILYRGEGLSLKETAKRMEIKVITVQVLAAQALRYLRTRMVEAGLWP
ncbi:MAG: RNA polymerase sigma factor [Novosphingobium sp.]|nr:RNA polymerase sigma factor [Novosphingobium sp.]